MTVGEGGDSLNGEAATHGGTPSASKAEDAHGSNIGGF